MNISAITSGHIGFKGVEKKDDLNVANIAVVGGGGRIGRNATRQYLLAKHAPSGVYNSWDALSEIYKNQNLVAINMGSMGLKGGKTIADVKDEDIITQLTTDSILGKLPESINMDVVRINDETLLHVSSKKGGNELIKLVATRDDVDFSDVNADIAIDTTGARTSKAAMQGLKESANVKYALLSAPSKEKDKSVEPMPTIVSGVNNERIKDIDASGGVASAASCTTTCISPIIKLVNDTFGVKNGYIETVHAATATQFTADKTKSTADSKARNSFDSMIPTTTGAAKAVGLVLPELKGKLDGTATRVPTADGSMAVITLNLNKNTNVDEVKAVLKAAEKDPAYKNLIAEAPKGSSSRDVIGRHESALYVPESIKVIDGNMLVIKAYYDNEFGYTRSLMSLSHDVSDKVITDKQKEACMNLEHHYN